MRDVKWGNRARLTAIDAASTAAGANAISGEMAESSYRYIDIEITASFAVAPTAAKTLSAYILYANNDGVYEAGSDSADPQGIPEEPMRLVAATGNQVKIIPLVMLPPRPYKICVTNDADQTAVITVKVNQYSEAFD